MASKGLRCCIVANFNGHGLSQDASVIEDILVGMGCDVVKKRRRDISWVGALINYRRYDVLIFLENIYLRWAFAAKKILLIPNQEWFKPKKTITLKLVDLVLCKSRYATAIFERYVGPRAQYIGFASNSLSLFDFSQDGNKKDFALFLHVAGGSQSKGTSRLIDVWRSLEDPPKLIIVQREGNAPNPSLLPESIDLITKYLPEDDLNKLKMEAGIHICPSESEGFGHNIFQGMLCGSVVITTNFPPMNELVNAQRGYLVEIDSVEPRRLGHTAKVSESVLADTISEIRATDMESLRLLGLSAKKFAEVEAADFRERFQRMICGLI